MLSEILNLLFKKNKECTHPHISIEKDAQYCPDCGQYVENHWYLTRCDCCNVKRVSTIRHGEIVPKSEFCPNCGGKHFHVERVKNINFIDIHFAVLVKEVKQIANGFAKDFTQSWLERDSNDAIKLLGTKACL